MIVDDQHLRLLLDEPDDDHPLHHANSSDPLLEALEKQNEAFMLRVEELRKEFMEVLRDEIKARGKK